MQSNGVNSRYLLNFGAAALTYVVARRYTQNNFALMSQGAVSFTAALAKSRFSKDLVGSDEKYSFGSFLLIFGIGALGGLPWKVNALASAAFAFGSYFFRTDVREVDSYSKVIEGHPFYNTGMTHALVGWAFGSSTEDVLEFLQGLIDQFKEDQLRKIFRTPNNPEKIDLIRGSGNPHNTPLMLLVKMGGEKAPEAVQKILPYYDRDALFLTTPNMNSALHIAVVTGQFDVAMALMKHAQELGVLEEFLDMRNYAGKTAEEIFQGLGGHENAFAPYLSFCDLVLGGEEINKAQAARGGGAAKILTIRNPFFERIKARFPDLRVNPKSIGDYSLRGFFDRLFPPQSGGSMSVHSEGQVLEDREVIRQLIINTPVYVESFQDYYSAIPSPEFISVFTHVHQILPGLYLGDYRAFLSVDPAFVVRYPMADEVQEIGAGYNNAALMRNVMPRLDMKGCSELGIGLVVSVTQFKPAPAVKEGDWSLFQPNLADIVRIQVHVDDTESTWELLEPELDGIFQEIDRARGEGKPILIHCVKGACRSAAVMIAYLMNRYGVTYEEAHNFVKSIRHQVDMKPSWIGSAEKGTGLLGYQAKLSMQFDLKR